MVRLVPYPWYALFAWRYGWYGTIGTVRLVRYGTPCHAYQPHRTKRTNRTKPTVPTVRTRESTRRNRILPYMFDILLRLLAPILNLANCSACHLVEIRNLEKFTCTRKTPLTDNNRCRSPMEMASETMVPRWGPQLRFGVYWYISVACS